VGAECDCALLLATTGLVTWREGEVGLRTWGRMNTGTQEGAPFVLRLGHLQALPGVVFPVRSVLELLHSLAWALTSPLLSWCGLGRCQSKAEPLAGI